MTDITYVHPCDPLLKPAFKKAREHFAEEMEAQLQEAKKNAPYSEPPMQGDRTEEKRYVMAHEVNDVREYVDHVLAAIETRLNTATQAHEQEQVMLDALRGVYCETVLGDTNEDHFGVFSDVMDLWETHYQELQKALPESQRTHTQKLHHVTQNVFSVLGTYKKLAALNDAALSQLIIARQHEQGVPLPRCIQEFDAYASKLYNDRHGFEADLEASDEEMSQFKKDLLNQIFAPYAVGLPEQPCPEQAYLIVKAASQYLKKQDQEAHKPKPDATLANDNDAGLGPYLLRPDVVQAVKLKLQPLSRKYPDMAAHTLDFLTAAVELGNEKSQRR